MRCLAWEYADIHSSSVLLSTIAFRYALITAKKSQLLWKEDLTHVAIVVSSQQTGCYLMAFQVEESLRRTRRR
jgi:hypothetical protein